MANISVELDRQIVEEGRDHIQKWINDQLRYSLREMVAAALQGPMIIDLGEQNVPRYMAGKWPDPAVILVPDFLQLPSNMHETPAGPLLPRYGDAVTGWMEEALRGSVLYPMLYEYPQWEKVLSAIGRHVTQELGVQDNSLLDALMKLPVVDQLRQVLWEEFFHVYRHFSVKEFIVKPDSNPWYWRGRPRFDENLGGYGAARIKTRLLPLENRRQLELQSAPHFCEYGYYRIHELEAMVRDADGDTIGWLRGYVFAAKYDDLSNQQFFFECDALNQEVTDLAHYLMQQHGDASEIFGYGDLFYLCDWEIHRDKRGQGIGMEALRALLRQVKRSFRLVNSLVVELEPMQFVPPFHATWPEAVVTEHEIACESLRQYWEREAPEKELSKDAGRTLFINITELRGHEESLELLGEYIFNGGSIL